MLGKRVPYGSAARDRFIRLGWAVTRPQRLNAVYSRFPTSNSQETRGRARRQLAPMRLTLIALSASYCVDALLAISTSTKASSHSCEAARRSVMTAGRAAVSGRTTRVSTIICRDGFFDSVTEQCNACAIHVHCHRLHTIPAHGLLDLVAEPQYSGSAPEMNVQHHDVQVSEAKYSPKSFGTADTSRNPRDSIPLDAVPRAL